MPRMARVPWVLTGLTAFSKDLLPEFFNRSLQLGLCESVAFSQIGGAGAAHDEDVLLGHRPHYRVGI